MRIDPTTPITDTLEAPPSAGRSVRIRVTGDGYPHTAREIEHRHPLSGEHARAVLRVLREALKREYDVRDGEPTPFRIDVDESAPRVEYTSRPVPPEPTFRDHVCGLVDDLAELDGEIHDHANVAIIVKVSQ